MENIQNSTIKLPSKKALWYAREALIYRQHYFNGLHIKYPERTTYYNELDEIEKAFREIEALYFSIGGSRPFEDKEIS